MKVSSRYRFGRAWTTCAAIVLGALAGLVVGRVAIWHSTQLRMGAYAQQLLQHDEEIAAEAMQTLQAADGGRAAICSEQDLVALRQLTFKARFLKDVGRVENGQLVCSAVSGKATKPVTLAVPDMMAAGGVAIYRSHAFNGLANDKAELLVRGHAEAVVSPDIFTEFSRAPFQFAVGPVDRVHGVMFLRPTGTMKIPSGQAGKVLGAGKVAAVGDTYYSARCSATYNVCAMTYVERTEMWHHFRSLIRIYVGTGTAAGLASAMGFLMVGHKRRSHTSQLKRAILMGKLSVAYQPIVELGTHRIVGAEALARWTDEDGDSIRPETIIALAEAEGFVSEITRFVLTRALDELGAILQANPDFQLNINLAPSDLADPRLLLLLDERLRENQATARNLNFELTERATSNREVAVAAIARLQKRGHSVLIDDFGTGYSNLAYLTELNVNGIKINRSFIATIGTDSVTASIVPQILAVAKALSLKVVVQGIEREEQAAYFAAEDPATLGQGWFFGMPIPARSLLYLCTERSE